MCNRAKFVLPLLFAALAGAQTPPWTGIVASSRAVDWSQAGLPATLPDGEATIHYPSGINYPPARTTICATIAPEGTSGSPVTPTDIDNAITSCPAGETVQLEAGSYYFSTGITFGGKSEVTLRGAGADQTFLYFSGTNGCNGFGASICIASTDNSYQGAPSNIANWTAGFSVGTTTITLSSTTNIVAGKTILALVQNNDATVDTGGVWNCAEGFTSPTQYEGNCAGQSPVNAHGAGQIQTVLATAINGNQVTISPGLYMPNWGASTNSAGSNTQAFWATSPVEGDGVENLSIDSSAVSGNGYGVVIDNGYADWVYGIRSYDTAFSHVYATLSLHCLMLSNYIDSTQNGSSESYGFSEGDSSNDLIINNIGEHVVAPVVEDGAAEGSVVAYNFSIDDYFTSGAAMLSAYQPHSIGVDYGLWEGNIGDSITWDQIHGTQNLLTAFRNRLWGIDKAAVARNQGTGALIVDIFHRYTNIIANVLGTSPWTTTARYVPPGANPSTSNPFGALLLGWTFYNPPNAAFQTMGDVLTAKSAMLWGNYDTVSGAVAWNSSDVPSGLDVTPAVTTTASPATTDGTTTTFTATLTTPILIGSVRLYVGGYLAAQDSNSGTGSIGASTTSNIPSGPTIPQSSGTINYTTGAVSVTFTSAPATGQAVKFIYLANPQTTASPYQNPVPASHTLPASFFLTSTPPFWTTPYGTPPWPNIGPDVTGGSGPGGYSWPNPAELCWENMAYDPNYTSGNQATISSITESGNTATITTTATVPASFVAPQTMWITGTSVAGYDGGCEIASASGTTVTCQVLNSGLGTSSGGTLTVHAVRLFNASRCYPGALLFYPRFFRSHGRIIAAAKTLDRKTAAFGAAGKGYKGNPWDNFR